jgi:hypothetical protein
MICARWSLLFCLVKGRKDEEEKNNECDGNHRTFILSSPFTSRDGYNTLTPAAEGGQKSADSFSLAKRQKQKKILPAGKLSSSLLPAACLSLVLWYILFPGGIVYHSLSTLDFVFCHKSRNNVNR